MHWWAGKTASHLVSILCAGKPTDMIINEYSDEYGFAAQAMKAKWLLPKPPRQAPASTAAIAAAG